MSCTPQASRALKCWTLIWMMHITGLPLVLSADSCQALFNSIQPSCYGSLVTFVNAYCNFTSPCFAETLLCDFSPLTSMKASTIDSAFKSTVSVVNPTSNFVSYSTVTIDSTFKSTTNVVNPTSTFFSYSTVTSISSISPTTSISTYGRACQEQNNTNIIFIAVSISIIFLLLAIVIIQTTLLIGLRLKILKRKGSQISSDAHILNVRVLTDNEEETTDSSTAQIVNDSYRKASRTSNPQESDYCEPLELLKRSPLRKQEETEEVINNQYRSLPPSEYSTPFDCVRPQSLKTRKNVKKSADYDQVTSKQLKINRKGKFPQKEKSAESTEEDGEVELGVVSAIQEGNPTRSSYESVQIQERGTESSIIGFSEEETDSRTCKVSKFDEYSTLRHTNALEEITEGSLDEENTYSKLRGTFKRKEEGEMKEEFQLPLHATVKMENS